ncbi:hypothetical protein FRAHR75_1270007 [Frankia sp. Hr75.2]|nr:hypothetical protein FRAHR75_1270007 [Frankia sp. Hr75.2]
MTRRHSGLGYRNPTTGPRRVPEKANRRVVNIYNGYPELMGHISRGHERTTGAVRIRTMVPVGLQNPDLACELVFCG